jgi:hypothetical protein
MDKEKLKLIVRNLESLVECLKSEIYSDIDSYKHESQYEEIAPYIEDYDEVFYDDEDDVFETVRVNQKYKLTNDDDGDGL